MKGIEGLPLKYLILILVATIVIGVVLTVVNQFTGTAQVGASQLGDTLGKQLNATTKDVCEGIGNCTWNSDTNECECS